MSDVNDDNIINIAKNKAKQSICRYKISAIGFNHRGELIGKSFNRQRFIRKGGGIHAEMHLMSRYGTALKTIIICRVNNSGECLPIDPCETCKRKADEMGIKIYSIKEHSVDE